MQLYPTIRKDPADCRGITTKEDETHVGPRPSVLDKEDATAKKVWRF